MAREKLVELFRNCKSLGILMFLARNEGLAFHISSIARQTNINRHTVSKIIRHFLKYNLIIHTKTKGKLEMYKINMKRFINKKIAELVEGHELREWD